MAADPAYYDDVLEGFGDAESLTVLVVSGRTREEVAAALGVDLAGTAPDPGVSEDLTGWSFLDITGGVLATEITGYGDPSLESLQRLSADGRAAAVVRGNIQGHYRFGYARDGAVLFDDDEYTWVDDRDVVPDEIRALFDLAWDDPDSEEMDEDAPDSMAVGLAMGETVTGLRITRADAEAVTTGPAFPGPMLVYTPA